MFSMRTRKTIPPPRLHRLEARTAPAAGMLDPTFSGDGRATLAFPIPSADIARATAIDASDRTIVAGTAGGQLALARYNANGVLDLSFGPGGKVVVPVHGYASDLAVDSQDRVIVVGATSFWGLNTSWVTRLTAAGDLDTTFGSGGLYVTGAFSSIGVAVDSLDRVVVVLGYPYSFQPTVTDGFFVQRLTATGTADNSFGGTGVVWSDFSPLIGDYASSVAVDSLDRVTIAGGAEGAFGLTRLTAAGALDTTFDEDGRITFGSSWWSGAGSVAVDSLDRIIAAGDINGDYAVARLTPMGALDSSFDGDGIVSIGLAAAYPSTDIAVDSLDRVVVAVTTSQNELTVARVTPTGALDASFDGDGKFIIAADSSYSWACDVGLDSQDRVVAAWTLNNDFAVARLTSAGAFDNSFDGDGRVTTGFMVSQAEGMAVAVDSLGRVLATVVNPSGAAVVRYRTDGTIDTGFGTNGYVTGVANVAVDSLDRVVGFRLTSNTQLAVTRLTAAGTPDPTFDGDGTATIDFGMHVGAPRLEVDSLDRIVVAGLLGDGSGSSRVVVRWTATGALDTNFDGDGVVQFNLTDPNYSSYLAVDSLGRVIVSGASGNGSNWDAVVVRLTTSGQFDPTFDGDGTMTVDFGWVDGTPSVTIDSMDRVVLAAEVYPTPAASPEVGVARLTSAGALDSSFDADGKVSFAFGPSGSFVYGVSVDALDRVVIAGELGYWGLGGAALARMTAAGSLDTSFDGDGKVTFDFGFSISGAKSVAIDAAGRAVVVGSTMGFGQEFALARLTGDTATAAVQVNDGAAQRSMVTSYTVTFSEPVTVPAGLSAAFQLQRTGPGTPTGPVALSFSQTGNTVTITFDDPTFAPGPAKSLIDGRYTLAVVASQVHSASGNLDGNLDGVSGGDLVFTTHRLFGDADGDGDADALDLRAFRAAFGNPANLAFDFDNDGDVDAADFGQFRRRFGTAV